MTSASAHPDDPHYIHRTGWLRAAVLGANDGIVSVSSLILGVAAATSDREPIIVAGVAGLVAGAMSMAAGEFISVSSQRDSENADIKREKQALAQTPEEELAELAGIYESRGLNPQTAATVARELTAHDPLKAHVRDELGLTDALSARPLQAAIASERHSVQPLPCPCLQHGWRLQRRSCRRLWWSRLLRWQSSACLARGQGVPRFCRALSEWWGGAFSQWRSRPRLVRCSVSPSEAVSALARNIRDVRMHACRRWPVLRGYQCCGDICAENA